MKRKAVKAHIYLAGSSPSEIADDLGVSRQMVSRVINNKGWSASIARRIAKVTGLPVSKLWPGRSSDSRSARVAIR
jgi:lambda repressor-like predicted transcriptional regulator